MYNVGSTPIYKLELILKFLKHILWAMYSWDVKATKMFSYGLECQVVSLLIFKSFIILFMHKYIYIFQYYVTVEGVPQRTFG